MIVFREMNITTFSKKNVAAVFFTFAFSQLSFALNITFVGDSITQGGNFLSGNVASYRYQLFKNFVDNDVEYNPLGTTSGAAKNIDVSSITPSYRGVTFSNISEAAASGRSYQYGGHAQSASYKADPGTVYPEKNRGPVTLKLGQNDLFTGTQNTFYNGATLTTYAGDTYQSLYGEEKTETLCVMIGINDLYDGRSNELILADVKNIVEAYQTYNPNVRVHLFELLPTAKNNGTGTSGKNNYFSYNEALRAVGGTWSTATSVVTVDNVSTGFYAESGAMVDTASGAHPNKQGELIVAGNIARVLGIGQRTAGLTRQRASDLISNTSFVSQDSGVSIKTVLGGREVGFSQYGTGFSVNENGNLVINTGLSGGNDFRLSWDNSGTEHEFTVSFSLKMNATGTSDNGFGIILGNGTGAGLLYVREYGIFWNNILLYGSDTLGDVTHNTFDATAGFNEFTIAYLNRNSGVDSGFYVWLGDQLIGESLDLISSVSVHKDKILFGDIGSSWKTNCELAALTFDAGSAWAPSTTATAPEPSAFALLSGLSTVALAVSRRRKKIKVLAL